jgi:hypothetical protein
MTSPPGGGMSARPKRASSGPAIGVLAVDVGLAVHAGGADDDLVVVAPLGARAQAAQHAQHRVDVADARDVADHDLVGRQDRGGEDRQGAVLVPGGGDGAAQRHSAVDDELLHEMRGRRLRGRSRRLG